MTPTQPTGWVGWHAAIPICSFSGRWGYDRRLGHKSRMGREFHVRFCEGLGVQFPRATRLVIGFTDEADARRVMEVLPKRFGKYGLSIHPDKTRLVPFARPQQQKGREEPESGNRPGGGPPETSPAGGGEDSAEAGVPKPPGGGAESPAGKGPALRSLAQAATST